MPIGLSPALSDALSPSVGRATVQIWLDPRLTRKLLPVAELPSGTMSTLGSTRLKSPTASTMRTTVHILRKLRRAKDVVEFWSFFTWYFELGGFFSTVAISPVIGAKRGIVSRLTWIFNHTRAKVITIGEDPAVIKAFDGIVLSTHKTFLDFTTTFLFGEGAYIGRRLAAAIMPMGSIGRKWSGMFIIFRRGNFKKEGSNLTSSIVKMLQGGPRGNTRVLVFPEGHRLPRRGLLRLRTGMIRICFDHKIPVYLAPSEGGEYILNEAAMMVQKDMPYVVNYAGTVDPADYQTWEDFYEEVSSRFSAAYDAACRKYDEAEADLGRPNRIRQYLEDKSSGL
ncbi:Acyltransferase [Carpediemonas membranifera]|uniref:Acyltransferase n=1 Tax=Carpediemonas membranifera TaxID=201153 RepID=A0A8J6E013_9EUKA|nr:Acyltransferase [Carpediemonas membranifera]|eukprot:KAG9391181.1 Acyltransferase [Carpediemonas membranifera]